MFTFHKWNTFSARADKNIFPRRGQLIQLSGPWAEWPRGFSRGAPSSPTVFLPETKRFFLPVRFYFCPGRKRTLSGTAPINSIIWPSGRIMNSCKGAPQTEPLGALPFFFCPKPKGFFSARWFHFCPGRKNRFKWTSWESRGSLAPQPWPPLGKGKNVKKGKELLV